MISSKFTELCNHHHDIILEHFHHRKKKMAAYLQALSIPTSNHY